MKKRQIPTILYSLALVVFTVYLLLDTFVITRVYTTVEDTKTASSGQSGTGNTGSSKTEQSTSDTDSNDTEQSTSDTESEASSATVTDTTYEDENIQITITEYRESDTTVYVAEILLSSADYLKTAFAQNSYGRNVTAKTSEIASENGAILAINGDYYGVQESGYVLRNGVLYRETASRNQEDLVIYADGSFEIITESAVSAKSLLERGAEQILSFGPALLENGTLSVTTTDEVSRAKTSNPRTAIGVIDDLHYLFIVSDGRTDESEGLTLYELASFAQGLGAETLYNLDGGGSSTLWFNGEVINKPTSGGSIKERSVSDIVYIGY